MAPPLLTKEELLALSRISSVRSALAIARVYGSAIIVIVAALVLGGAWLVPAILIIGALQHAMSILLHESVHSLLFKNRKLNDAVGNLIGYSIGFSLAYRTVHFPHHRELGGIDDPDMRNYGSFPATRAALLRKIVLDFCGVGAVLQFFGSRFKSGARTSLSHGELIGIAAVQTFILGCFWLMGHPLMYVVLWLLPLVTIAKGLAQLRNLSEHLVRPGTVPAGAERLRTFKSSLIERFFIAPLNFNYHAEHHWYSMVPYYNLPKLRTLLKERAGYTESAAWCPSYLGVIRQAVVA